MTKATYPMVGIVAFVMFIQVYFIGGLYCYNCYTWTLADAYSLFPKIAFTRVTKS